MNNAIGYLAMFMSFILFIGMIVVFFINPFISVILAFCLRYTIIVWGNSELLIK